MTDEYQRGFADAKDTIGKMIAGAISGIAGMRLIADVKGDGDDVKAADVAIKTMNTIIDEIDTITVPSPSPESR